MGSLTEGMTRLCGEIVRQRGARLTFIRDLGQNVAEMKADLRRDHSEMARQTKQERQDFVLELGHEVEVLLRGFRRAHKDMARQSSAARLAAVNEIKVCVGGRCQEFALDLAGGRRAWNGPTPAERRAQVEAERRAKAEAEQRAKEAAAQPRQAAAARAREGAHRPPGGQAAKEEATRPGKKKG
jgi:hypothetical protein